MKLLSILFFLLIASQGLLTAQSSKIGRADLKQLQNMDDSLGEWGGKMLDELLPTDRMRADSQFTRTLVRAMRIPYSFYFPFDSLQTAPILYPIDSSFRIITWHYALKDSEFRQKGAIQMNTSDGSLKLFPLFDVSDYTETPADSIRGPRNWIGAVYYALITKMNVANGKPVYTLLGYDENDDITTRKWVDVLSFDDNGDPQWGGHEYFDIKSDSIFPASHQRLMMEYKKDGRARLNYDEEDQMIILDHLISETGEPEKKYTLIPSGDYEGLKWENNRWIYIERLQTDNLGDGNEPNPALILDDAGNANEAGLQKQSDKNMERAKKAEKPAATGTKNPPKKKG